MYSRGKKIMLLIFAAAAVSCISVPSASAAPTEAAQDAVDCARRLNPTSAELILGSGHRMTVDFYAPDIFRLFRDDNGGIVRNPEADPPADILVRNPRRAVTYSISETDTVWELTTGVLKVSFAKADGTMTVTDLRSGADIPDAADAVVVSPALEYEYVEVSK